jgi:hypothetical protein
VLYAPALVFHDDRVADTLDADLIDRQMARVGAVLYVCYLCDGIHVELSICCLMRNYTYYPTITVG